MQTVARRHAWSDPRRKMSRRRQAPNSVSYQFLQCFIDFERNNQQTQWYNKKHGKTQRFGVPGPPIEPVRARKSLEERQSSSPGHEKSSERDHRAHQRAKSRSRRVDRPGAGLSAGKRFTRISLLIFIFVFFVTHFFEGVKVS